MVSSLGDGFSKLIVDSIHGDIHLKEREVQVIDTPSFQRLRQLKQLAMAQLVYPTATHTRFAQIDARRSKYPDHEEVGALIVTAQADLVKAIGGEERAKAVADIFTRRETADPQLSKLIHSSFDIDRWDYLLRDSYAAGVPYGQIDINYLLNNLKVSPQRMLGFKDKALAAVEHLLLARFFMHRVVYYHKTIYGMEEACRQLLRRLRDRDDKRYHVPKDGEEVRRLVQSEALYTFTDAFVEGVVREATEDEDDAVRALARAIQSRRPPKLLKEVAVCEDVEKKTHAGRIFMQNCRSKLRGLAEEFDIPLAQFLLCEPYVRVVKPPEKPTFEQVAKMEAGEIQKRAFEEEEEDIKIFVADAEEPISLMEIEHSLVVKYADYAFQLFRLYVIYEGSDKEEIIERLKARVKDWDKS